MELNNDNLMFLGICGLGVLAVGVFAHEVHQTNKVDKAVKKLGYSMDNVMNRTEVEIADSIVQEAVTTAAKAEAGRVVKNVSDSIVSDVRKDMHSQVEAAISSIFYSTKDDVRDLMKKKVGDMSSVEIERARRSVIEEGKRELIEKLESDLDDAIDDARDKIDDKVDELIDDVEDRLTKLFDRYDSQLKDTQRIYSSVSRALGDK